MAAVSRYFAHAIVLLVAITVGGYASISKDLPAAAKLRLGVVNAEGLALGEGGTTGSVELGRAGTIVKPLTVPTAPQTRHEPIAYTVHTGEDVYAIARKYGVSADDVRWSNPDKLTHTDLITAGEQLVIPPVGGIVVTFKAGDSVAALSAAYRVPAQAIIDFNYVRDPTAVATGAELVVPGATGPRLWPRRDSDQPPRIGSFPHDTFAYGQCTWYAASRRPVPWVGDAWMWYGNAKAMGYQVGQTPEPGAFMITWESPWYGHVAYVEQVNEDGSFVISEMNYKGWDQIDERTVVPADFSKIRLIGFIY